MHKSSADGWHDVDHDHLIQLVAVEVGIIPALALADLMKPEGSVRAVCADDAPDRARLSRSRTRQANRMPKPALDEQRALGSLADDRDVIDDGDTDGDEVLKVKGTVRALPARQVGEEGGAPATPPAERAQVSTRSRRTSPRPRISSADGKTIWRRKREQPVVGAEQPSGLVVHLDRQHAATLFRHASCKLTCHSRAEWASGTFGGRSASFSASRGRRSAWQRRS